ncbi:copper transporter [Streptosporangiaceae bacterium NEAU-GS5]|nr:copper transporter [Streptosporangiaceae bacterium NEAU-GS5]
MAIFLALTVGIVLGSTVLDNTLVKSTDVLLDQAREQNDAYRAQIIHLQELSEGDNAFVTTHSGELVGGRLTGERVVLVEAPGASASMRDPLEKMIDAAGGDFAGRVTFTDKYIAKEQAAVVDGLAGTLSPDGRPFPDGASPYDKAASVIANAIVTANRSEQRTVNGATVSVLASFQAGGLITVSGDPAERATLAIVIAPSQPYDGDYAEAQTAAVVSLAAGLDNVGMGTVLAGSTLASDQGGVIAALHDDGTAAAKVTSVDTVDMPAGRVVVVYALREQLAGRAGAYGVGSEATAFEPPVPVSPTPSP